MPATPSICGCCAQVGARDVIIVPLAAPARTLGAITLVSSQDGKRLSNADLGHRRASRAPRGDRH